MTVGKGEKNQPLQLEYRAQLYEDYAASFKNSTGQFDYAAAKSWKPCLVHYLRNWLPTNKEARIIDLGCGDGRIIYLLKQLGYSNIEGVDISESQLKISRQVSDRIVKADVLEYLAETTANYDLILSFDVIEHLRKDEVLKFLDLCRMRLNTGGRLILQTPNASSPFFGDVRYGDLTHELAFTPNLLTQLVTRAGFDSVSCRETGPVPKGYSIKSSIRFLIWKIIRMVICLMEMVETGGCGHRIHTRVFFLSAVRRND